ncbi:MAG: hypothetical protein ACLQVI_10515 [Polyangiaceae bacterium]
MSTLRRRIIPFALLGTSLATATSFFACGSSPSAETGPSGDAAAPGDSSPQTTADSGSSALDAGTGDATIADGSTGDAGFVQASHLPFPSIVYSGAPLLLAPKVVSIVFKSDPFVTSLEEFGAGITSTTTWWPTVISEYCDGDGGCVGKGPAGVSAEIDASAPAAVYDPSLGPGDAGGAVNIQTFINDLIAAGTVPAPDANTIYALYLPTTTDFNGGGSGCDQGFEGYHSQATYQSQTYVYSINVECAGTLTDVTVTSAHETAEGSSDGIATETTGGYYMNYNDLNTWGWLDAFDSEIADMCDDYYNLGQDHWTEGSFVYQRIWSVKAATANENPCKPVPVGEVYFNAAPATAFLEMNVGETITVEVDAFSDAPMGNWTILAQDGTDPTGATVYTSMSFSGGTTQDAGPGSALVTGVNNGSKPQLSITLTQDPSQVQNGEIGPGYGEADIYLWSYTGPDTNIANATAGHYWTMAVMTRADATDAGLTFLDGGVPEKHMGHAEQVRRGPARRGVHRTSPRPGFTR